MPEEASAMLSLTLGVPKRRFNTLLVPEKIRPPKVNCPTADGVPAYKLPPERVTVPPKAEPFIIPTLPVPHRLAPVFTVTFPEPNVPATIRLPALTEIAPVFALNPDKVSVPPLCTIAPLPLRLPA